MCGFCGIIDTEGKEIKRKSIDRMNSLLSHRGPDDEGIYIENKPHRSSTPVISIGLGHKRLSIIDLSKAGRQPMSNEDKSLWMVFNGEVYNYIKLKKEMENYGHHFKSQTDCEVVIHLYEQEGIESVNQLNGMFAFALWDSKAQILYLCRDRLGIKPLYYYRNANSLIFASEIKSILCDPQVPKEIDWNALNLYLTFNYIPAPYTIFENIKKLEPGCFIKFGKSIFQKKQYWDVRNDKRPYENNAENLDVYKKNLYGLLKDSVKKRLITDVPLGAFLSGGIDSSIIVGLMSQISSQPVKTYSIGYKDMPLFDETNYAQEVAKLNNTEHHEIMLTSKDVLNVIPEILNYFDEPFADSSAIPTCIVSRESSKYVKVALSGDGGDELFAGYRMYSGEYWYSFYRLIPSLIRNKLIKPLFQWLPASRDIYFLEHIRRMKKFISGTQDTLENRFFSWNEIFSESLRRKLIKEKPNDSTINFSLGKDMIEKKMDCFYSDKINRMLYTDLRLSLPSDMLAKVDMMSMKNSLEVRVPFLDHRVVEYVFQMPGSLKLRAKKGKYILLETFKPLLPPSLLKKPKWGFEIPISRWLKSDLNFLIDEYLSKNLIKKQKLFDFRVIDGLVKNLSSNRFDTSWHLWNLIIFQAWYSKYFQP